jgi:hypothetical protein
MLKVSNDVKREMEMEKVRIRERELAFIAISFLTFFILFSLFDFVYFRSNDFFLLSLPLLFL